MEGNLQLLYVLLTDCYVYLLRKGACHPRPERVGLSSPPPALDPHFKHILMTRCPQGGPASWATYPHPVCRSAPLLLGTEGAGAGEKISQDNGCCHLLSQGPQRNHTWWKKPFLTMNLTMCR